MNRWFLGILALVIGFGVGWLVFHPKPQVASKGVVRHIKVYQKNDDDTVDPDVDPPEQEMYTDDVAVWRHVGKKVKDVHIEFKEEVFYGMTQVGTAPDIRWAIPNCSGEGCASLWPKVSPSDYKYKYWQILHDPGNPKGNRKEKDGWIIIR